MNWDVTERVHRGRLLVVMRWLAGLRSDAPIERPGSAFRCNPMAGAPSHRIVCRFAPDADWIPPPERPWGRGYYLYILNEAAIGTTAARRRISSQFGSVLGGIVGSSWKVPRSVWNSATPVTSGKRSRVTMWACFRGFGIRDPNAIAYFWETMSDGYCRSAAQSPPTFVWRMPIPGDGIN